MTKGRIATSIGLSLLLSCPLLTGLRAETHKSFVPGEKWTDTEGVHINAHGGGMLFHNGTYYWFGEHKIETTAGNRAHVGVRCYSSADLYNWKNEGVALAVAPEGSGSDIEKGCIIERPKVIYNPKTRKFVMFFHLELKADKNYESSRVGIATADQPTGPYTYLHSLRPNAGCYPASYKEGDELFFNIYFLRDVESGHKSRDMTLFVDDDGKAYHIFSSEDNGTLHVAELSDDYLSHTGVFERIAPGGYNEAPAIFKYGKHYYMITSGCTGWSPNPARMFSATNLFGPWTEHPNPCTGTNSHTTFKSQSTYILPVEGKKGAFLFMADRWMPDNPIDGTYVWLPLEFENGLPVLKWHDEWNLDFFTHTHADLQAAIASGKRLLSSAAIGNNVGEHPQEACDAYDAALRKAEQLTSDADSDAVANALMELNDVATTFQESGHPYELNTLEEGDYYIKVNGQYYLTNADTLADRAKLPVSPEKITETAAQVFTLSKHPATGRYRIVSKLDGRNVNEDVRIRSDWGENDHQWRTFHLFYNGDNYAIRNDGKTGYGGLWKYDSTARTVTPSGDMHLPVDNDSYFIFSFEKAGEHSGSPSTPAQPGYTVSYDRTHAILIYRGLLPHAAKVSIFDAHGRTCAAWTPANPANGWSLDLTGWSNGLYIVKIEGNGSAYKFIK